MASNTLMEKEARQAPELVAKQWQANQAIINEICAHLNEAKPHFAMTIGRGSSDHAATFAKYLLETRLGLATVSAAPSVLTLYGSQLNVKNALVIALSQSGKSPDICEMLEVARQGGAITIAIVNDAESRLAQAAQYVLPLHAGPEKAVAASKSYIASLAALIQLTANYKNDKPLLNCMKAVPDALHETLNMDWSPALKQLKSVKDILVLARGYGLPIAQEIALKFKETLSIHAEAFSGAEVIHGPFAMIKKNYPLFMLAQGDVSLLSMLDLAKRAKDLGAKTLLAIPQNQVPSNTLNDLASCILPLPKSIHPICDPLMAIQAFYPMVAELSVLSGFNPDAPENLTKVTQTR